MNRPVRNIIFSIFSSVTLILIGCGGSGGSSEGGGACNSLNAKVFGGETCSQTARSPVVAIYPIVDNGSQLLVAGICTGTLVTLDDIITSAHCFTQPLLKYGSQIEAFAVRIAGDEVFLITNFAIHPLYDGAVASPYDVAMATINGVPNPPIGPVPVLISQPTVSGQRASTFGYGTNNKGETGVLKSAELTIESFEGGNILIRTDRSGASICQGDSGGPLIQRINGVASLIGINSFGRGIASSEECASTGSVFSGFVDIQSTAVLEFMANYVPDIAVN